MSDKIRRPKIETIALGGKKYPRCEFCPYRLSELPAGERRMTDAELEATIRRYMNHIKAEHPEQTTRLEGE